MDRSGYAKIRVGLISPPDRQFLAADLMVDNEQLAEVNQEDGELAVEIYGRRDGAPWLLRFEELSSALLEAKRRLNEG